MIILVYDRLTLLQLVLIITVLIGVRLLAMLVNDLPVVIHMILIMMLVLGVRLVTMLVSDLPVLKITSGFQRLELQVILLIFPSL